LQAYFELIDYQKFKFQAKIMEDDKKKVFDYKTLQAKVSGRGNIDNKNLVKCG
jgi:hypothetical protein